MRTLVVENNDLVLGIFKSCFNEEELQHIDFATCNSEAIEKMDSNVYSKIVANYNPSDKVDIFSEAKNRNIDRRIMITASSRCNPDCTEATCGVRKPLTLRTIREICLEDRSHIETLYGFMSRQA
jgi:hypothetical protein